MSKMSINSLVSALGGRMASPQLRDAGDSMGNYNPTKEVLSKIVNVVRKWSGQGLTGLRGVFELANAAMQTGYKRQWTPSPSMYPHLAPQPR